jgi:hypothetical protein
VAAKARQDHIRHTSSELSAPQARHPAAHKIFPTGRQRIHKLFTVLNQLQLLSHLNKVYNNVAIDLENAFGLLREPTVFSSKTL